MTTLSNIITPSNVLTTTNTATVTNKTLTSPTVTGMVVSDGTANGVTYLNGSKVLTSGSALTFDGTNLGLGVTPSAWSGFKVLEMQGGSVGSSGTGTMRVFNNVYYNGTNWIYKNTAPASRYELDGNTHVWYTAPSGTAGNAITFTQAMTLDASGNLGVGTTSPSTRLHIAGATTATSQLTTQHTGSAVTTVFGCDGGLDVGAVYVTTNHPLAFKTNNTERARIDSSGNLLVGGTNSTPAESNVSGASIVSTGGMQLSRDGAAGLKVNRRTDDGELVAFLQAGTQEGNITVSGTTVSYNGGHLSRYAQTTTAKDNSLVKGTVLSNLDEMNVYTKDGQPVDNEQLNKVKVSDTEGDVNVAGVFVNWSHDDAHNVDEINMAMTGDMIIRIAQGVTVVRGDLLMSAGDGTAKPQGDDIIRSKTVAKVTSNHVTCTYADGSYCVPCVLMAC